MHTWSCTHTRMYIAMIIIFSYTTDQGPYLVTRKFHFFLKYLAHNLERNLLNYDEHNV